MDYCSFVAMNLGSGVSLPSCSRQNFRPHSTCYRTVSVSDCQYFYCLTWRSEPAALRHYVYSRPPWSLYDFSSPTQQISRMYVFNWSSSQSFHSHRLNPNLYSKVAPLEQV